MPKEKSTGELTGIRKYFKEQNIEISFNRIAIQAFGGMAHGLFASLLIGTIISTIGTFLPGAAGAFMLSVTEYTRAVQGAAMALAIGYSIGCPPYVLYSLATVGFAANKLGGAGGALAVIFVAVIAAFFGKLVSKRTPIDLIVTPAVTILTGCLAALFLAPPIGEVAVWLGNLIMWGTQLQPLLMGILVAVMIGLILTFPMSSAAICAALGLVGLAGGAAVAGCCAHMVGFAVCSYRDNKVNGLASVGLGTSKLLFPNVMKKPILLLPPVITSIITGPIATCIFKLEMNGEPISAGMGTCGLVGPIGVITGWLTPSEKALSAGLAAIHPGVMDWLGLALICVILPAAICFILSELMRKAGLIKDGDYKLL